MLMFLFVLHKILVLFDTCWPNKFYIAGFGTKKVPDLQSNHVIMCLSHGLSQPPASATSSGHRGRLMALNTTRIHGT